MVNFVLNPMGLILLFHFLVKLYNLFEGFNISAFSLSSFHLSFFRCGLGLYFGNI